MVSQLCEQEGKLCLTSTSRSCDLDPNETSEWVETRGCRTKRPSSRYLLRQVLKRSRKLNVGVPALIRRYYQHIPLTKSRSFRRTNHGKVFDGSSVGTPWPWFSVPMLSCLWWTFHRTLRLQVSTKLASTISSEGHKYMVWADYVKVM